MNTHLHTPSLAIGRDAIQSWLRAPLLGLLIVAACFAQSLSLKADTILFVYAPSGGVPTETDQALITELTVGLGHTVTLRGVTSAAEKPAASEADAVDLVVVSESVSSGNVADAFKDVTKPVLLLEGFIADDMEVATPGTVLDQTQAEILNPDHPLAAGLSGTVDLYRAPKTLITYTGLTPAAINIAAALGTPDLSVLVAYLPGAEMLNGFVAPGRRLCLGLHSAVPEQYTAQARALFRAAATWALGLPVETSRAQTKPTIARNPADAPVFVGQRAEFIVDVRGSDPLSYQWQRGTSDIASATSSILRFTVTSADDGATFRVVVTNALGSVSSLPATLTVLPDDGRKVLVAFSETTGTSTANLGNLGGGGKFALASNYPQFSAKVPTGPFAPSGNTGSVDFGAIEDGQGGRAIDFSNDYGNGIGAYNALTICGWLNLRDLRVGPGGNRIAFAATSVGGSGFDLVQNSDGGLSLGINGVPDGAPASSPGIITEDPGAGPANWIFFAVTYDSAAVSGNVSYYFGRGDAAASLDTALDNAGGPIGSTGQLALGNFAAVDLNRNVQGPENSRVLRGLMDEFRIFNMVLSPAEIQAEQKSSLEVPPVALTATLAGGNVIISWPAGSTFQLQGRDQVNQGNWLNVGTSPILVGGQQTVTLPVSGSSQFYRLQGQ